MRELRFCTTAESNIGLKPRMKGFRPIHNTPSCCHSKKSPVHLEPSCVLNIL